MCSTIPPLFYFFYFFLGEDEKPDSSVQIKASITLDRHWLYIWITVIITPGLNKEKQNSMSLHKWLPNNIFGSGFLQ